MKRVIASTAFFLLLAASGFAQQEPLISHYMFNHLLVNPAYAGSKDYAMASALFRKQWVNLEGAPTTILGSLHGPVFKSRKVGLGISISNDKIGVTNTTDVFVDYAYHIPVTQTLKLGLGVSAGISHTNAKVQDLRLSDLGVVDPVFDEGPRKNTTPNFGAGLFLHSEKFFLGVSVPRFLSYDADRSISVTGTDNPAFVRHMWATTGVALEVSEDFVVRPSVMVRYSKNAPIQADINANFLIKQLIWLGATFRTGDEDAGMPEAVVGLVELQLTKQLRLGYSYDFTMSPLNDYSNGSHEISLGFDFGRDIKKIKSPRYF
jgi:type IX secretion system PorP/SprF family membrane protein